MNAIAELLSAASILPDLQARSKDELFAAFGRLFESASAVSGDQVVASLKAREKLGSTGLGQGIAIPHGRIKGLAEARGAYARLAVPIAFDAPDGKPVAQVFVLLVPEHATEKHLQLLSELAQMFSDRRFRDALAAAPDAETMYASFADWTAR